MSVVRPVVYTEMYNEEFEGNRPVSEETIRKLIYNFNMLRALLPYAQVVAYHINLSGVSIPSADYFAYCDGTEINAPDSPLDGGGTQFTPDMVNRYIRGATSSTTSGNEADSHTLDLTHTHDVGVYNTTVSIQDGSTRQAFYLSHTHTLPDDMDVVNLDVKHMQVAFYLRINR